MGEFISNPPDAENLYPSVASMGHYSLDAAIADIIDNSITAEANCIDIFCDWNNGDPYINIIDDGIGMDFSELLIATKLGSKNPKAERDKKDLGRFGLGLKTASFSQGKVLTVISSKDGKKINGIRIDIDDIKNFKAEKLTNNDIENVIHNKNSSSSFTEIQWNKLHRVYDEKNKIIDEKSFNELIIQAKRDLELTFHRYLEKEALNKKVIIRLNNNNLEPNDPFYKEKSEIWGKQEFSVFKRKIKMQTYILPHYRDLDKNSYEKLAGKEGYVRNQGFYVYRNRRLIFKGTWFKLAKHGDLSKLARVQLDIPNDIDEQFKITIDKSYAELPRGLRERMKGLIESLKGKSTKVFRHAGTKIDNSKTINIWSRLIKEDRITYQINREHPIIKSFKSKLSKENTNYFESIIGLITKTIPSDTISIDIRDNPNKIVTTNTDRDYIESLALDFF